MNAISYLLKDHNKVRKVLADIADDSHRFTTKKNLFKHLSQELLRHEKMEHKVWYPYLIRNTKIKSEIKKLLKEEKHAENAIKKMNAIKDEEAWISKFSKFKKSVEAHASEEERDLFPHVKSILDNKELEEIGREMREFKEGYSS